MTCFCESLVFSTDSRLDVLYSLTEEDLQFRDITICTPLCIILLSPAEHEHVVGGGIVRQGYELLKTQLLTATVKAVRTVCTHGVVIATRSVLHRPQAFGTLYMNQKNKRKRQQVTMTRAESRNAMSRDAINYWHL